MFHKYLLPILLLVVAANVANADDDFVEEHIEASPRTWNQDGIRLGLPGLANILSHTAKPELVQEFAHFEDVLPYGDNKLVIPLKHVVSYGGKEYRHLTIASGGRIFLGDYKKYVLPEDGFDGLYPYVKTVANEFVPVVGASSIPVRWRKFNEHNDVFTVVEFGPFNVVGHADNLLCQASFYDDGEIQVQHWNLDRSVAFVMRGSSYSSLVEGSYMLSPYVYNGGKRVSLSGDELKRVYRKWLIPIFDKGNLREGWIAKPFQKDGPLFYITTEGNAKYLDVDFGKNPFAGGVIAYDHARENPVVGSFEKISFSTRELYNTLQDEPIYVWYFNEKTTNFFNKTKEAGYPYLANDKRNLSKEAALLAVAENCVIDAIHPCAYSYSWIPLKKPLDVIDTVAAPAIKMQVVHDREDVNYKGRKTRINYIRVLPMQPMSYQFRPTGQHEIKFASKNEISEVENEKIGYLDVSGIKVGAGTPLTMPEGTSVDAKIKLPPGYEVSTIEINGFLAYDEKSKSSFVNGVGTAVTSFSEFMGNHPYIPPLRGYYIDKLVTKNEMQIRFPLINDVKILVTYKTCSKKELSHVVPSFIKNEVFLDPSNNTKTLETYSVKDGFGQVVQTQTALNAGLFSISATYLDDADNIQYAPKSYVVKKSAYGFENMYCYQCVLNSAAYYDGNTRDSKERVDSYGFPYTEKDYHYGENRAVVSSIAGMGEASFALGDNPVKKWKLPLKTDASSEFFDLKQIQTDFAGLPNGVEDFFDRYYGDRLKALADDELSVDGSVSYPFELTVNKSVDGVFTQSISDAAGNLIAAWVADNQDVLITRYVYYPQTSQLWYTYIESRPEFITSYEYDYAGRLIATVSPDRGRLETKYDSKNRICFTRDARQISHPKSNGDYFNIFIYDEQDRLIKMGEVRGECNGCSFDFPDTDVPEGSIYLLSETIYGVPTVAVLTAKSNSLSNSLAANIVNSIDGVGLNDVGAIISYDGHGHVNTMKMASYDRLGRKKKYWIVNLVDAGAPAIEIEYNYTKAGQIAKTVISKWDDSQRKWVPISKRVMTYDDDDRFNHLEKIYEQSLTDDKDIKLLVHYKHNPVGTLEKTTYYDNGQEVMSKKVDGDIYGRTTNIVYKDANGDNLYSENLEYKAPLINRLSSIKHSWADNTPQEKTANESYDYDELGRLTTFTTDMNGMTGGQYTYDLLGRLTTKSEGGSSIALGYVNGSYRPVMVSENGSAIDRAVEYDASGNLWLDGKNKVAYKINALGLPERVARFNDHFPDDLLYEDFMDDKDYDGENGDGGPGGEWATVGFKYDESGNRIFENSVTRGSSVYGRVTVPGVAMFEKNRYTAYELKRLDLIGGGFRLGIDGEALFPLTDVQGNIRVYVGRSGWSGMHAYYPYGTIYDIRNDVGEDKRRWQSKDFDGEHGKYYFGARYYDPFLGLWMSPDPMGQFMNPYTYGGDPLNYVDPTGLFSLGLGLVFGWDADHGWHIGFGVAADFSTSGDNSGFGFGFNLSYTWNQDGSNSFNLGGNASFWFYGIDVNLGLSYSYNSYSGSVLSTHGGVCFGKKGVACAGVEAGGSLYWNKDGNFMGATAFVGAYAEVAGGLARVSGGYEMGFFGMEGRGLYAGVTVAGLHGEVSWRDGSSFGFDESLYIGYGNNTFNDEGNRAGNILSMELWMPALGQIGHFTFGDKYDVSPEGGAKAQNEYIKGVRESLGDLNPEEDYLYYLKPGKTYTKDQINAISNLMKRAGYSVDFVKAHTFFNKHEGDKYTFYKPSFWGGYGNVELIVGSEKSYASFNYGNHWWTHLMIDLLGYKWRKW